METVLVSKAGRLVGRVRFDPLTDDFDPDPGVPPDVVSDVVVAYYRDNVLFVRSGDGYAWSAAGLAVGASGALATGAADQEGPSIDS